jgi:hypothetical protein
LLQRSFLLATPGVQVQYIVDFGFVSPTPRGKAFTNEIWFLPDQANVEHGADYQRS